LLLISKGVIRESLGNGLCLLLKRVETSPVVAMVTHCKSGRLHDPDELAGLTELLQRLYFQGSEKYSTAHAVNQAVFAAGGMLSSSAALDHSTATSLLPSAYFSNALNVQADALQHPLLDPATVDQLSEGIRIEQRLRAQSPSFRATELLHGLTFRRHRLGRLRLGLGPGEALAGLSRNELLAYHRHHFRPGNVIVAVVGNIDMQPTLRALAELYGEIEPETPQRPAGLAEEEQTAPRLVEELCRGPAAELRIGFAAPGEMEGDRFPLEVLCCLIDQGFFGRLLQDFPDRQRLLHAVTASYALTGTAGLWSLAAAVDPARLLATEQAVFEALETLRKEPIPAEELARAKSFLRARFLSSLQFVHRQAEALARFEALGGHHLLDVYLGKLSAVTAEDVQRVCEQVLGFERACLVQCRPEAAGPAPTDLKSLYLALEPAAGQGPARPSVRWRSATGEVQIARLPGGPTLLVQSSKKVPVLALGAFFAGGRWDERPEQNGWTHLCLSAAADTRLARRLGALGCALVPLVTRDYFGLALSCLPEDFKLAGKLFFSLLRRPAFDEAALRCEAQAQAAAALERQGSEQRCLDLLIEALYGEHPYGRPALGTASQLQASQLGALGSWFRQLLRRDRLVVSLVGEMEPEQLVEQVLEIWLGERVEPELAPPAPPAPPAPRPAAVLEARIGTPGSYQMLGFPACSAVAPERAGLMILQATLRDEAWGLHHRFGALASGSRVWSIGPLWGQLAGALCLYGVSAADAERELRGRILEAIERIRLEPMPEDVLERAKETVLGKHHLRQQSPSAVMLLAARHQLLGLGPEERVRLTEVLRAVDREQLHTWTMQWLDPQRMCIGVARG
jgi:zinc protease